MDILAIILLVISTLGWAACFILSTVWMYKILARKGYHYPHIVFLLIPGGMIAVTVVLILLVVVLAYKQLSAIDTTKITGILLFSLVFYAPLLASAGLFALILHEVPLKQRLGPRKVPFLYRGASILLIVASIVSPVVFLVVFHLSIVNSLRLLAPLTTAALACSYLAYRAAAPDLDETLRADTRPSVLYLRTFKDEERLFARPPRGARDVLSQYFNRYSHSPNKLYQTFEEFFTVSIRTRLGPFVALGNPEDSLPPLGAGRTYASDETWKKEVERLAKDALCILAPVSQSESLEWELGHLMRSGLLKKLFILTPPSASQPLTSPLVRLIDFLIRLLTVESIEKWKRREAMPWEDFRAALAKLGYILPITDPGLGSIVAFDRTGNATTIVQGVGTADEYLEAIAMRLSQAHESIPSCKSVK